MFDIDRNLQMVIVVFIGILVLLYKKKPKMMFHEDGKVKEFGRIRTLPYLILFTASSRAIFLHG